MINLRGRIYFNVGCSSYAHSNRQPTESPAQIIIPNLHPPGPEFPIFDLPDDKS
jgi:hypothetical protein